MKKLFSVLVVVGLCAAQMPQVRAADAVESGQSTMTLVAQERVQWLWGQIMIKHPYLSSSVVAVATFFWFMKDNALFMEKWNSLFGTRRPRALTLDDMCQCIAVKGYCDCGPNAAGCPCVQVKTSCCCTGDVVAPVEKAVQKTKVAQEEKKSVLTKTRGRYLLKETKA